MGHTTLEAGLDESDNELLTGLRRIALELTAGCNEQCVHCCVSAGPGKFKLDRLVVADYEHLLSDARDLGCASVQFIGGEPAAKKQELNHLVRFSKNVGYKGIEVYTNLTILPDFLLQTFKDCEVSIATSIYSSEPELHDAITRRKGSHAITSQNLLRVVSAGLPVRVGIIGMEQNKANLEEATRYVQSLGVADVGVDYVRGVGRAKTEEDPFSQLCHSCWKGSLVVASDGKVYPCTIGRDFPIGNVLDGTLRDVLAGEMLRDFRKRSYDESISRYAGPCKPDECAPDRECSPEYCTPKDCNPRYCNPRKEYCNPGKPTRCGPEADCKPHW